MPLRHGFCVFHRTSIKNCNILVKMLNSNTTNDTKFIKMHYAKRFNAFYKLKVMLFFVKSDMMQILLCKK